MRTIRTIDIGREFSEVPAGRYPDDGEANGQRFREGFLVPALRNSELVQVILDNTEGYGSSFLEEAFGGLVRLEGFTKDELERKLEIIAKAARSQRYKRKIMEYIEKARPETQQNG